MSFQGDVGGIGLAELLQSLSRGRREGVLSLHTERGLSSRLGLSEGSVIFLPDDDEDPQLWRERVRQAWLNDFDERMVAMRMSEIARANRIERVYQILDSEEVHFRFEPGDLPTGPSGPVTQSSDDPDAPRPGEVHCQGLAVELLLLEYARMSDEARGVTTKLESPNYLVPRSLDPGAAARRQVRFLQECDGSSTLAEISDRMGWPIRQTRLVLLGHLGRGEVRLAEYRELLVLAQRELAQGHISRASARLVSWVQASPPGPLEEGDAALLAAEFKADRMGPLLNLMPGREARSLLRRMDHAWADPATAVSHWRELQRLRHADGIVEVHRLGAEFRWPEDRETPLLRDLLEAACRQLEAGVPGRAAPFLRMAGSRGPENADARLDIGLAMLACGLIEEGAAWILDACQTFIATGDPEKAISPLNTLVASDGSLREARRMLGRLKHLTLRRKLLRKHSVIALAIVAVLASVGWVRLSSQQRIERKLTEIAGLVDRPAEARALLETYFPDEDDERVERLRGVIDNRLKFDETELRNGWHESYREAQLECALGDPEQGLRLALGLPTPPKLTRFAKPWPLLSDLHNGLAARLENDRAALGEIALDDAHQVEKEKALAEVTRRVRAMLAEVEESVDTRGLAEQLQALTEHLRTRVQERVRRAAAREQHDLLSRQDLMLAAARAHDQAGDLNKSIAVYENLLATDQSGRLVTLLVDEFDDVRRRHSGLTRARELAGAGQHDEALSVLEQEFGDSRAQRLPWTLDVFPGGALVQLADGSTVAAPFVFESRRDERIEFLVEHEGHRSRTLVIENPADRFVWLSKTPDRSWNPGGRIDALPVAVGADQIVCDRTGKVARISAGDRRPWEFEVLSLGGISRAPVFMPAKPDHLLLLTEDGEAWMIDSQSGERTGPWELGSGPAEGPVPTGDGVLARLKDGRMMYWDKRVKPVERAQAEIPAGSHRGTHVGLAVLHREEGARRLLESPWTPWRVELRDEVYRVHEDHDPEGGYAVRRRGDWSYLAWEAPCPDAPRGRLWISDAGGLAAYTP